MAVRPHDLIIGRSGTEGEDARVSADAVERVWEGQDKPLPSVSTAPSAAVAAPPPPPPHQPERVNDRHDHANAGRSG